MANSDSSIVYMDSDGTLSIIHPSDKCTLTVEEIAKKDVPTGLKYKIVNTSDIPTDRSFRNAWYAEETDLTDGVGS